MATEAVTYSNLEMVECNKAFASGLLTSDGTIAYISLGFTPAKIVLREYQDTNVNMIEWIKGMDSGTYWLTTGSTGVVTKGASGGPVVWDGDDDESCGFYIPAALLTDADTWLWEAWV